MQKSTLPQGVKSLMSWSEKNTLTFDNPVQRAGSQWNLLQKNLLIHSMLANYPVPAVYLLKSKSEENGTVYDCLDAKQRLTSVFEFIRGEYALHSVTPEGRLPAIANAFAEYFRLGDVHILSTNGGTDETDETEMVLKTEAWENGRDSVEEEACANEESA